MYVVPKTMLAYERFISPFEQRRYVLLEQSQPVGQSFHSHATYLINNPGKNTTSRRNAYILCTIHIPAQNEIPKEIERSEGKKR